MIDIEKIYQNQLYKQCIETIKNDFRIDIETFINQISKQAIEIAENIRINSSTIEMAVLLSFIGLSVKDEDYIKSSGILAVKILSELNEDEDSIAKILMAIAGQGNNLNSVNIFSAIILLACLKDFRTYMILNKIDKQVIEEIVLEEFDVLYSKKEVQYTLNIKQFNEKTNEIVEYINKLIETSAHMLEFKVVRNIKR